MDVLDTLRDSMTAEDDPAVQEALDAQDKATIQHLTTNSSRVFVWKQVAQYSLAAMGIFGGMTLGGDALLSQDVALSIAGLCGISGFGSSVVAHHIDLKNKVSLEELYAKRTGKYIAQSLDKVIAQQMQPVPPSQTQNVALASNEQPRTDISSAQHVSDTLIPPPTSMSIH